MKKVFKLKKVKIQKACYDSYKCSSKNLKQKANEKQKAYANLDFCRCNVKFRPKHEIK
jgi:hypothetical protein